MAVLHGSAAVCLGSHACLHLQAPQDGAIRLCAPGVPSNALACPDCPAPAGLLNVEDPEAVQALVQRAAAEINACLQLGGDVRRARLLLRFCVALVATNVLHAASVLAALRSLVDTALAAAEASEWC